jgi:hypothetical protein
MPSGFLASTTLTFWPIATVESIEIFAFVASSENERVFLLTVTFSVLPASYALTVPTYVCDWDFDVPAAVVTFVSLESPSSSCRHEGRPPPTRA